MTQHDWIELIGKVAVVWAGVMILMMVAYGLYQSSRTKQQARDSWCDDVVNGDARREPVVTPWPVPVAHGVEMVDVRGFHERTGD